RVAASAITSQPSLTHFCIRIRTIRLDNPVTWPEQSQGIRRHRMQDRDKTYRGPWGRRECT
ncbi:MAG: hypothetical protein Q7J98_06010, partial [Kiritimatiellia bacterium]|nr:hypothetical protein [Kiritimatiellia bacterium]